METELNECIHVNVSPITHTHMYTQTYTRGKLCKWVAILWAVCTLLHRLLRCQSPPCLSFSSPSISVISFCMRRARHTHRDTKIPWTRDGTQARPPTHSHSHTVHTLMPNSLLYLSIQTWLWNKTKKKQYESKTKQKSQKNHKHFVSWYLRTKIANQTETNINNNNKLSESFLAGRLKLE